MTGYKRPWPLYLEKWMLSYIHPIIQHIHLHKEVAPTWQDVVLHHGALKKQEWSSKKWKKIHVNTDWRKIAKLSGFSVSTLLDQNESQPVDD